MRIGIDARFLTHPQLGGFKTYTENLIAALAEVDQENQYFLYLDREPDQNTRIPDKSNFTTRVVPAWLPFFGMVWREQFRLPRWAVQDKLDLLHSPCLSSPLVMSCAAVVTIHDVIWHSPKKFAGNKGKPLSIRRALQDWYYRIVPNLAAKNAHTIITVSETSKNDIMQMLEVPSEKIYVTYEAASVDFREIRNEQLIRSVREKYDLTSDFVLALGSADPRKNIQTLFKAYKMLPAYIQERYQLVIVWNHGFLTSSIEQEVEAADLCDRVKFLEWVTNEDLVLLYNAATLFAFPSRYEGFGLPLLEAMACGTPIVAANNSSIPEIADKAALLIEAEDANALAEAITQALDDESLRTDLIEKGFKRAAFFSWEKCAMQTIDVYKQVVVARRMTEMAIKGAARNVYPVE